MEDVTETNEHEEVEENDEAELKKHLLLKEGIMAHYQLIRAVVSSKRYSSMIRMLQDIDREDLQTLWKLVKIKHGDIRPEDEHERVLWGDLKVMFEPDIKSDVWRNLQGYKVTIWKLYDSCGVHFVRIGINKQGTAAMEKLVEKLENVKEKAECKKLKKELEEASLSNTFLLFEERPNKAIDVPIEDEKSPLSEPRGSPPDVYLCSLLSLYQVKRISCYEGLPDCFLLVNVTEIKPPKSIPMTQAAIRRMIKESVDVVIATERARQANVRNDASGSGPVRGRDTAPVVRECTFAGFMKCNPAAFRRVEGAVELRRWFEKTNDVFPISVNVLRVRRMVDPERVKVDAYIRGLMDNIKGKVTSSKPAYLNEACTIKCHKCGKVRHKARYCRENSVAMGANAQPIWTCYDCGEQSHTRNRCLKKVKQEEVGEVRGQAYAIKDAEPKGPNVVTSTFLLNNRYASALFDSGFDRSFVNTRFSSLLDIKPIKIEDSHEVELADGSVVSTNTILKGCTLSLVNHIFEIDLMPIELGTFDVIIGMDWLVKHDAIIICGEKVVRIPYRNKTLIVEGDKGRYRLKIILCIMVRKYVEQGFHLFLAHVTKKKSKEKRMEDVPVICDFP
ncbi:putative reverse transcriptase domain-containing protein [Tanacetum coccineum]